MPKKQQIITAFENLDADALEQLLDDYKTYEDVPKKLFVDRYREYFQNLKDDEELICDRCNGVKHEMSTEVQLELVFEPAKAKIIRHVRYVYGCRGCEKNGTEVPIVTAPAPAAS